MSRSGVVAGAAHRPSRTRRLSSWHAVLALAAILAGSLSSLQPAHAVTPPVTALVLYDTTGPDGWLGELYAIAARILPGTSVRW